MMSWAMIEHGRHWHRWDGDRALCGIDRGAREWTPGSIEAPDCEACVQAMAARIGRALVENLGKR